MWTYNKVLQYPINIKCPNPKLAKFINTYWDDRKMIRTFPNLKIKDKDGNLIYFADQVGDIQPYYYKFNFNLKKNKDEIFEE